MMGGWYHDGVGWGGWIMMTLAMAAFWAVVVFALVALLRGNGSRDQGAGATDHQPRPLELLDERFARGEIDEEEYRNRREVLRGIDS